MPRFNKIVGPDRPPRTGPWFVAQYDGECADCGFAIEYGETICADGKGGYLCGDCGEEAKETE